MEKITDLFDLTGWVAIVTGAASGLGREISVGLAAYGARVALVDINEKGLAEVQQVIEQEEGTVFIQVCNVVDYPDVQKTVKNVYEHWQRIDVLVNSAGISKRAPAEEMSMELWDHVMDVNLKGSFMFCQAVGKIMLQQGRGSIINISSIAGQVGNERGNAAFSSSKGGVDSLTRLLAVEWAKRGVRVNAVAPCTFKTAIVDWINDESMYPGILAGIPIGRFGEPEEIVGPVIFLASEASSMVTGHVLSVDGGHLVDGRRNF
jgi:NAD(P)-dependent dehydrogenase (short-subunit alcohol dehydrogenase family)